jgi:hypothetical protein
MEIPMGDIINSYRQQLSDVIHTLTLRNLHITALEKKLDDKREQIADLKMQLGYYELAGDQQDNPQVNLEGLEFEHG